MTTGNREDYLINILRLTEGDGVAKTTELASFMNVSPASVSEMVKILANEGLVRYEKYKGMSLTEEGLTQKEISEYIHIAHEEGMAVMAHANGKTAYYAALAGVDSVEH